jgi:UDP-2,3-diacylglucosamine pyrophosphatase LpxH
MSKEFYKSIFISDVHLGLDSSNEGVLLDFLENVKCDNLYIVGDFIDFIHLYEHHGWSKKCNLVIRKILSKLRKGSKIKICIGNHDAFLGVVRGFKLGDIEIKKRFVHKNKYIDYLVLHGDRFDSNMKYATIVKALSFIYAHFTWFPLMNMVKSFVDSLAERSMDIESMLDYARDKGADGVIYGHTHNPYKDGNLLNCGDWINHCSAVVETEDDEMKVIYWKKNK